MKAKPEKQNKNEKCFCPYCEEELVVSYSPLCRSCKVTFRRCAKCQMTILDKNATHCPKCGQPLS